MRHSRVSGETSATAQKSAPDHIVALSVDRLAAASVFKLIGIGSLCSMMPISVVAGVLSLFGKTTITWFGRPRTGLAGLGAAPVVGLATCVTSTVVVGGLVAGGLWLYSNFRSVQIHYFRRAA